MQGTDTNDKINVNKLTKAIVWQISCYKANK